MSSFLRKQESWIELRLKDSGSGTGMTIFHQFIISAAARYAHHTHIIPLPLQVLTRAADNLMRRSIGEPVSELCG